MTRYQDRIRSFYAGYFHLGGNGLEHHGCGPKSKLVICGIIPPLDIPKMNQCTIIYIHFGMWTAIYWSGLTLEFSSTACAPFYGWTSLKSWWIFPWISHDVHRIQASMPQDVLARRILCQDLTSIIPPGPRGSLRCQAPATIWPKLCQHGTEEEIKQWIYDTWPIFGPEWGDWNTVGMGLRWSKGQFWQVETMLWHVFTVKYLVFSGTCPLKLIQWTVFPTRFLMVLLMSSLEWIIRGGNCCSLYIYNMGHLPIKQPPGLLLLRG